jgi:hypothetical protein
VIRYNPANPDQNRDATGGLLDELPLFIVFVAIIYGFCCWLKWILGSEKAIAVRRESGEQTEIV